jgi:integrase
VAAILQQKRGKWGVLTIYRGRRKWQTVGEGEPGRRASEALATEVNRQLELRARRESSEFLGWHVPGTPLPIDRALYDWLLHYGPTVRRATLERYRTHVEKQLVPYFGPKDLAGLRDTDVIGFASTAFAAGAARDPVLNALSCMRRVVHLALERGHLETNPLPRLVRLAKQVARAQGKTKVHTDAWTKEEATTLLTFSSKHEPHFYPLLCFAFHTGARKSEIIGLRWSAVHLDERTIDIVFAISHGEGGAPKWGKNRTIQIPKRICELLSDLRTTANRRNLARGDDWVFRAVGRGRVGPGKRPHGSSGAAWSESFVNRVLNRLLDLTAPLGVRRLPFHATRHSYASWALSEGHDPLDVANNLGHSPEVLWTRYAHALRGRRAHDFSFLDLPTTDPVRPGSRLRAL